MTWNRLVASKIPISRVGDIAGIHNKIMWRCNKCNHGWMAKPSNILNRHTGCSQCRTPSYSKKAVRWLEERRIMDGVDIQHAENGGEFTIPGTTIKVDGYSRTTNTIYEFYGDIFHGNPARFAHDCKCSPYHNLTAGQLYQRTLEKENRILEHGYTLITIWETDYDKQTK